MAKKPAKTSKTIAKAPAKPAPKAKAAAPVAAKPAEEPAKPAAKKPVVAPKPVPPHQQFLSKGVQGGLKPQHMSKGRIFRHQGR